MFRDDAIELEEVVRHIVNDAPTAFRPRSGGELPFGRTEEQTMRFETTQVLEPQNRVAHVPAGDGVVDANPVDAPRFGAIRQCLQ